MSFGIKILTQKEMYSYASQLTLCSLEDLEQKVFYARPDEIFVDHYYDIDETSFKEMGTEAAASGPRKVSNAALVRRDFFGGRSVLLLNIYDPEKNIWRELKDEEAEKFIGDRIFRICHAILVTKRFRIGNETIDVFASLGKVTASVKMAEIKEGVAEPLFAKLDVSNQTPRIQELCEFLLSDLNFEISK